MKEQSNTLEKLEQLKECLPKAARGLYAAMTKYMHKLAAIEQAVLKLEPQYQPGIVMYGNCRGLLAPLLHCSVRLLLIST